MVKKTRKLALKTETLRRLDSLTREQLGRVAGGTYVLVPPNPLPLPDYDEYLYRLTGGNSYDSRCG